MESGDKRDLLDLLYEGGDESALSSAEKDELARWRAVRGAMRELPDAEPPDAIGVLMAAARQQAEAAPPRGAWARLRAWFSVMAAHPAMSAAATVVLVAGVAGAFYVSGRVRDDEPAVMAPATSGSAAGAGAAPGVIANPEQRELEKAPEGKVPDEKPASATVADPNAAAGQSKGTLAAEPAPEKEAFAAPPGHAGGVRRMAPPKPTTTIASGGHSGGASMGASGDGKTITRGDDDGLVADKDEAPRGAKLDSPTPAPVARAPVAHAPVAPAPVAPAAAPPPPAPAPAADVEESPAEEVAVPIAGAAPSQPAKKQTASAAALTRQAKAAAKQKDCKTVDALASQVVQLDAAYYRASFATDADIRDNCEAATRK